MKKIAVMEKVNFNQEQVARLRNLGQVDFYDNLTDSQVNQIAPQYDATVVNWIDPTPYLLDMRPGSLVALLSTGYGWISNLEMAREQKIFVANIPGYSTEAVAEHLLGLLLGLSKRIFPLIGSKSDDGVQGFEIVGKTVGIIGLGHIGTRFAHIISFFGGNVLTYNRNLKHNPIAKDVTLDELLTQSDIIVLTPSMNPDSRGLINNRNIDLINERAVIIGSTWDVITEEALITLLSTKNAVAAFDAALEGKQSITGEVEQSLNKLSAQKKLFLTPHSAYNTVEAERRQLDICVNNIESFFSGTMKNIVN